MATRSLSRTEARVVLSLEEEGREDLTLAELRVRARISSSFARKVAHDLVRKHWLQRVGRGRYLLNPSRQGAEGVPDTDPLRLGSRLAAPYYFGYATAAELLGLLPQASRVYYVVTPRRGGDLVRPFARIRRVTTAAGRIFGVQELVRRGERLSVSDPERTVLDCLSRPELSGGIGGVVQILSSRAGRMDWARLHRHLDRLGSHSLSRRLGYLLEWLDPRPPVPAGWLERLRARDGGAYVPLGPPREFGRRGPHDARWRIVRNVPEALLRSEVEIR